MKHIIKIQEICQCNHISREHAELIIQETQNALNIYLEVILTFKGITGISLEASSIIRNYIFDNNLEKSIYLINMTPYVRQVFFHNSKTSKETNENDMNNTNQKELSKFGKWFIDVMNNQCCAIVLIIFGLSALALFLEPYHMQTFKDMSGTSKAIVIFGLVCVITALVYLIKLIIKVNKQTDLFK